MSGKEIKGLFPGKFVAVVKGYKVQFSAKRSGVLIGKYYDEVDRGRWSVRNGRLCIMLKNWMSGETDCSPVHYADGWYRADTVKFRKARSH